MKNSNNNEGLISDETSDQINDWGRTILRSKTALIKPFSKYTEEGIRPRTPNPPYTILTKEQQSAIERSAYPLFFDTSLQSTSAGAFRHFRQRQSDSIPISHLKDQEKSNLRTQFTYITAEEYNAKLSSGYDGCSINAYPKWYPNRAGERIETHLNVESEPVERHVMIDAYRRPPTARAGQILFDHGRPNDGYYLERKAYDNTWFPSTLTLNRRRILDSIQSKTSDEYQQEKSRVQDTYYQARKRWPHLSEYQEEYVIPFVTEHVPRTDLERAKQHIAKNPTRYISTHNNMMVSAIACGKTLINEPSLTVKCDV